MVEVSLLQLSQLGYENIKWKFKEGTLPWSSTVLICQKNIFFLFSCHF